MTISNQYREFLSSLAFFKGFDPKEMEVLLGVLRLQRLDYLCRWRLGCHPH